MKKKKKRPATNTVYLSSLQYFGKRDGLRLITFVVVCSQTRLIAMGMKAVWGWRVISLH